MRSLSSKLGGIGLAMLMASVLVMLFCHGNTGTLLEVLIFASAEIGMIFMLSGWIVDGSFCPSNMKEIKRSEDPIRFWFSVSLIFIVFNILLVSISLSGPFRAKQNPKNPETIPHVSQ